MTDTKKQIKFGQILIGVGLGVILCVAVYNSCTFGGGALICALPGSSTAGLCE